MTDSEDTYVFRNTPRSTERTLETMLTLIRTRLEANFEQGAPITITIRIHDDRAPTPKEEARHDHK